MSNARIDFPLPPAFAAGTIARVGGSLHRGGVPRSSRRIAPLPIDRGVTR